MKSPDNNKMSKMHWSKSNDLIASGYQDGQLTIFSANLSREHPGAVSIETTHTLDIHKSKISTVKWSDNGKLLATGDSSGRIAFFTRSERGIKNSVSNATVQAAVNCISITKNSKTVAIAYKDNTCACVAYDGSLNWSNEMRSEIEFVEWSPNGNVLLCGTNFGEVLVVDHNGNETGKVLLPCLNQSSEEPKLVTIEWHKRAEYGLLLAFKGGKIQLMRNESDSQPLIITIDITIHSATWFTSGSAFVLCGAKPNGRCAAFFFSSHGDLIRETELQGKEILAVSIDQTDTNMAIVTDSLFCLAQIIPSVLWGYTMNTLVYAYDKNGDGMFTTIFYNKKSNEKRLQTHKAISSVCAHSGFFGLTSSQNGENGNITITNTIGVTLSSCEIPFLPLSSSVFGKIFACRSLTKVAIWRFQEEEKPQFIDFKEKVTAILLRERMLLVSSGTTLFIYDIPSLTEVQKIALDVECDNISASLDNSLISYTDNIGILRFYDMSTHKVSEFMLKDIWNFAWSKDTVNQFAALERSKLILYTNFQTEDPIPCLSHIADFSDQEIISVDIIRLLKDPMNPTQRYFRSHATKQLQLLRKMLNSRETNSVEEIFQFLKESNKIKLWDEFAESMMLEMNFSMAERCYLETTNYRGLQFVKRVRSVKDSTIQRAQVLSYLGRFDEAESLYISMDRLDLAIEMRTNIGDYQHVIKVMSSGIRDDETASSAYTAVGDVFCERAQWSEAAEAYKQAKNYEKLMKALFLAQDIQGLDGLVMSLPQSSPLYSQIGKMFVSVGAVEMAVNAFTCAGDISSAIDACARMNHWKPALALAGKGRSAEIKSRMVQYANTLIANGQRAAAVDFYVSAGLNVEAAKLLLTAGDGIFALDDDLIAAKMCYVFAGLQLESHRKDAFDNTVNSDERLEGLMKEDEISSSGLHREIWRKAEGVHYYLLSNNFINENRWKDALFAACRVFDDYSDVIGEVKSASLLAYCGIKTKHYGQCSRAMTTLEHSDSLSQSQREKYEELAIDIFTRNRPVDPKQVGSIPCPKCSNDVSMLNSQCPECGERMRICTATSRLIDTSDYWECKWCKHCCFSDIGSSLTICPLCHHRVD